MTLLHAWSMLGFPLAVFFAWRWREQKLVDAMNQLEWARSSFSSRRNMLALPYAINCAWLGVGLGLLLARWLPWEIVTR